MKFNLKIGIAAMVIIVTIILATSVVRPTTYSGLGLNFPVSNGAVTITNASKDALPVQLTGSGYGSFIVTSKADGVGGSSIKQTTDSTTSQLWQFNQPSGVTTFIVAKGSNLKYSAGADARLQASVLPMTDDDTRNVGLLAIVVILVCAYYISAQTNHAFARKLLHRELPVPVVAPVVVAEAADANRGRDGRMYSNYGRDD